MYSDIKRPKEWGRNYNNHYYYPYTPRESPASLRAQAGPCGSAVYRGQQRLKQHDLQSLTFSILPPSCALCPYPAAESERNSS